MSSLEVDEGRSGNDQCDFYNAHFNATGPATLAAEQMSEMCVETIDEAFIATTLPRAVHEREVDRSVTLVDGGVDTRLTRAMKKFDTSDQRYFVQAIVRYNNVLNCMRPNAMDVDWDEGRRENGYRTIAVTHIVNHVMRTQRRIRENENRMTRGEAQWDESMRDQAFARPSVLVLTPFRSTVLAFVDTLRKVVTESTDLKATQGFDKLQELCDGEPETLRTDLPPDYEKIFAGDTDEDFCTGVKFMKRALSISADASTADVIVSTPLAIVMKEQENAEILSSIEIVLLDKADVLMMQNWAHVVTTCRQRLNVAPEKIDVDIRRMKPWHMDGGARWRQTIVLSSYFSYDLASVLPENNRARVVIMRREFVGTVDRVLAVQQVDKVEFEYFDVASKLAEDVEKRLAIFRDCVWPKKVLTGELSRLMIVVPTELELSILRHFVFMQRYPDLAVAYCAESASAVEVSQARDRFYHGSASVLVITERFHFYRRYRIRGVHHVYFYAPPMHPHFFLELSLMVVPQCKESGDKANITVLCSRNDAPLLAQLMGTARATQLLKSFDSDPPEKNRTTVRSMKACSSHRWKSLNYIVRGTELSETKERFYEMLTPEFSFKQDFARNPLHLVKERSHSNIS